MTFLGEKKVAPVVNIFMSASIPWLLPLFSFSNTVLMQLVLSTPQQSRASTRLRLLSLALRSFAPLACGPRLFLALRLFGHPEWDTDFVTCKPTYTPEKRPGGVLEGNWKLQSMQFINVCALGAQLDSQEEPCYGTFTHTFHGRPRTCSSCSFSYFAQKIYVQPHTPPIDTEDGKDEIFSLVSCFLSLSLARRSVSCGCSRSGS